MRLLRLSWRRKNDKYLRADVVGDPEAIRDLYWQLTHNYKAVDGTEISEIKIHNINGEEVGIKDLMSQPHSCVYPSTTLEN